VVRSGGEGEMEVKKKKKGVPTVKNGIRRLGLRDLPLPCWEDLPERWTDPTGKDTSSRMAKKVGEESWGGGY